MTSENSANHTLATQNLAQSVFTTLAIRPFEHRPTIHWLIAGAVCWLLSLAFASPTLGQKTNDEFISYEFLSSHNTALFQVVTQKDVAEELDLTKSQGLDCYKIYQKMIKEIEAGISIHRPPMISLAQQKAMSEEEIHAHVSKNSEKMTEVRNQIGEKYHPQYLDTLFPEQQERLKELIAQSHLNQGTIFGEYESKELPDWIEVDDEKRLELKEKTRLLREDFLAKTQALHAKHHKKIRETLDEDSQQKLQQIYGDPIELTEEDFYPTSRKRKR